ncbi:hypothetical protein VTN77DRAFT_220 [Rasamsonia byssochlamydoides]|uniref:uncharacterized protein n=1 Tax=Rasamsonia byssochlamydoides TaxID=89139 RepID=UPI003742B65D
MAGNPYAVYKELVRQQRQQERFGPQDDNPSVITESRIKTRREIAIGRSLRRGIIIIIVCWVLYFLYVSRLLVKTPTPTSPGNHLVDDSISTTHDVGGHSETTGGKKVPLEVHIMSKCPDARDCLQQLVVPAMEKISDKVDFQLSFIASVSNKSSEVDCMHGPTECIGDMLILCAANLPFPPSQKSSSSSSSLASGPHTPTIRSLGFANCLISSYEKIPERTLVENCALEHGIDFDALNQCASREDDDDPYEDDDPEDPSGIALLRKSARRSEALGVKKSCTVRLDESVWCVRDGGVWKDCAKGGEGSKVRTLVEEVEKLWKERN